MFRFLYVTDLHGWTNGYEEILQIALQENIDTIVNGGDMLPNGKNLIFAQRLFVEEYLSSYCENLQSFGITYYGMFGNDDCRSVLSSWEELTKTYKNLYDLTNNWLPLPDDLKIRGCNFIPDPPFGLKDWCVLDSKDFIRPPQYGQPVLSGKNRFLSIDNIDKFFQDRPTLEKLLEQISQQTDSWEKAIFVCHAPPAGLGLGNIDLDIDVGSTALKKWIETTQPLLTLHGHIHESPEITGCHTAHLGRTTLHQPGQQRHQGKLAYSLISIEDSFVEIKRFIRLLI